ncbi:hypothetical protein SLE2022_396970 [Rubroshorea leprosula]
MGQIVKRKKKGRPSKADLARRGVSPATGPESEPRRSLRRRNVRYNIDYDDYLDEDFEEDEEEEERGREKKLKLVVKLNQSGEVATAEATLQSRGREAARGRHVGKDEEGEEEEEDEEEEFERKKVKKRRINGGDEEDDDVDDEDDDGRGAEGRGRKGESKGNDSVPGTPSDHQIGVPLPDKKTLELILDKLQKKDTYGVYAEPVDPEELPDYHDVIEHPMDFATVRKKLGNGSYSTLEQFESDIFLICSNAMQYNAPDTIYHKQARAIQELATKKFQKLRINVERSEKDSKSEQKAKASFSAKKQMKKPFGRTTQEPVASDFSSGVTLATAGDMQNASITIQPNGCDKPSNTDIFVEGHSSLLDNNLERAEELSSGKGLLPKFGRKSVVLDENRRATYNMSNQPVVRSDSIFTTFEGEIKQLIPVGLQTEYSYARSLARFAATLGPVAWKVASRRIEQAVPAGCKFGRGWVGEYEPLPTPVLMLENCPQKEYSMFTRSQHSADPQKENLTHKRPVPAKENPVKEPVSVSNSSSFRVSSGSSSEGKSSIFASGVSKPGNPVNAIYQQKKSSPRIYGKPENKVSKQVELNLPPPANQTNANVIAKKQSSNKPEMSCSRETVMRNMGPGQSIPSKPVENKGVGNDSLPNGKTPNQVVRAANYFPHGQEQGLSDPIQVMRMLTERAQKQQNSSNQPTVDTPPAMPSVPFTKRDDSSSAPAAAHGWMSIGAGGFKQVTESSSTPKGQISADSLYNPARDHPQIQLVRGEFPISMGMQFQSQSQSPNNSFPLQAFAPQPVRLVEAHLQNRPMVFPQIVATDLSRFQVQSPWRGFSPQTQPRQKQESLPPDLNIGFQSPGSPAKQSSGVHVDSQQPDLALQL